MPLETEIKLRVESHEPVRERLRSLDAEFSGRVLETNILFDDARGRLARHGCGLRVRAVSVEEGEVRPDTLTFKGPRMRGAVKRREELELHVDSGETAARVLEALGYAVILRYQKRRESWTLGGCRIELDEPPHHGLFVEIEGPDEGVIGAVRRRIGLESAQVEDETYVSMLMGWCKRNGIVDRVVNLP